MLDLLFVGVFHMGIAGAGYGTAAANMVRCLLSILYLRRKTEIFQCGNAKLRMKDVVRIFRLGSVDASYSAMMALQGVLMLKILLAVFGESGGTINAVCRFSLVFASVAIQSIQGSARPLSGIYNGARDVRNQLMIKFFPDSCIVTIMDDGRCIMLDEDEETKELITNNSMIRKTVSSVKYQYILNLNYTVFCFA